MTSTPQTLEVSHFQQLDSFAVYTISRAVDSREKFVSLSAVFSGDWVTLNDVALM